MRRALLSVLIALAAAGAGAAELEIDFSKFPAGETPSGFRSFLTGKGQPGQWKIVQDDAPSAMAPFSPNAPVSSKMSVLAQVSADATDERFPILVYEGESFGDFKLATQIKAVAGEKERMAGIVFRFQDEKNFYVIRASSLGNTLRFYKVVNGVRSDPIGPEMKIPSGVWHQLTIECKGNQIRCLFNGKEPFPALTDNSFAAGRIGFWTKSDSVSHFANARITYTPRVPAAQSLVEDTLKIYDRLKGLKIYARQDEKSDVRVIASNDPKEIGTPGSKVETDAIQTGANYYGKERRTVTVTVPLRDRNGDPVAAVKFIMESFPGQTRDNAFARAMPIARAMGDRIKSGKELFE